MMRWATAHKIAVVPRGMGTGLSGGATALNGGIVLSTEKMRDIAVDPVTRTAVAQPGLLNAEVKEDGRRVRLVVSPGPVVVRDLQHRRQHRHQRRRVVLREIRRDHRLRARAAGGAGRRDGGAPGRAAAQGRRRVVADQAVRRQRGHAGRDHRGDVAAAATPARRVHRGGHASTRSRPPPTPSLGRHRQDPAVDAGVHGRRRRSTPSRTSCAWAWTAARPR